MRHPALQRVDRKPGRHFHQRPVTAAAARRSCACRQVHSFQLLEDVLELVREQLGVIVDERQLDDGLEPAARISREAGARPRRGPQTRGVPRGDHDAHAGRGGNHDELALQRG